MSVSILSLEPEHRKNRLGHHRGRKTWEIPAVQDGIHLPTSETRRGYGQRQVRKVMQTASQLLPAENTLREAMERVRSSASRTWLVTDRRGVIGVVNLAKLEQELAEGTDKKVGDLVDALAFPHIHSDQRLDLALERMGANQIEILPVVSRGRAQVGRDCNAAGCFGCVRREPRLIGLSLISGFLPNQCPNFCVPEAPETGIIAFSS